MSDETIDPDDLPEEPSAPVFARIRPCDDNARSGEAWRLHLQRDPDFGPSVLVSERVLPEKVFDPGAHRVIASGGRVTMTSAEVRWLRRALDELIDVLDEEDARTTDAEVEHRLLHEGASLGVAVVLATDKEEIALHTSGNWLAEMVRDLGPDRLDLGAPDNGLWLWRGTTRPVRDVEGVVEDCEFVGEWRRLTPYELVVVARGDNPIKEAP
jgi:hypothetical protein